MAQTSTKRARPAFSPPHPKTSASTKKVLKSKDTNKRSRGKPSYNRSQKKQKFRAVSISSESDPEDASDSALQSQSQSESPDPEPEQSPEPDFMLVEVTHGTSSEPAIPIPLVQLILHHHFEDKEITKLNRVAKEVMGKYVEIFVREAIMRASYEGNERAGGGDDSGMGGSDAEMATRQHDWLEVQDLEKISAQLCLDF